MKKKLLIVPILLSLLLCINVKAKSYTPDEVDPSTYIVGTHMFTSEGSDIYDGTFTTEWIMSASRSFGEEATYEDMIIYRKQARGGWVNAISGNSITPPESFEIEYIDEVRINDLDIELTISIQGEPAPYMKIIGYDLDAFCALGDETGCLEYGIDGIEVFEKTEDGEYLPLNLPGEDQNGNTLSFRLFNIKNVEKTVVARVYKTVGGRKEYGANSNELVINTKIPAPIISVNGNPSPYIKFMGIDEEQYCTYEEDENQQTVRICSIDGLQFYAKDFLTGEYREVELPLEIENDLIGNRIFEVIGERKIYVAKAYIVENGEKLYSDSSNELEMLIEIEKPVIRENGNPSPYVKFIGINEEQYCTYQEDENEETVRVCSIDGLEFYEVDPETGEYTEVELPLEVENDLIGNRIFNKIDESKTYVARAYKVVDGARKYSDYSNELPMYIEIEKPVLIGNGHPAPYVMFMGINEEQYCSYQEDENEEPVRVCSIDGLEFYEVDPETGEYNEVELDLEVEDDLIGNRIFNQINTRKVYVIRAYKVVDGARKYSKYSDELEFYLPVPTPDIRISGVSCDNETCGMDVGSGIITEAIYSAGDPEHDEDPIFYYDYIDLFEEGENEPIFTGIPTGGERRVPGIPVNTTKSFYARAYALDGTDKIYGAPTGSIEITFIKDPELVSATAIDFNAWTINDNQGIKDNEGKYTVTVKQDEENAIVVTDKGMVPYVGGNSPTPKKWVGIIVDFGVQVQGEGYTVMPEDYLEASRWGATSDTAFVLWTTTDYPRTIRFVNTSNPNSGVDFTIWFEEDMEDYLTIQAATNLDVTNADPNTEANIINNTPKYTVAKKDGNTIVITDNGVVAYKGGYLPNEDHKWFGFIVDFGVRVDGVGGYGIEEADRTDAPRWGATSETAFIMWLKEDESGTYKFRDAQNKEINLTVLIEQGTEEDN